MTQTVRHAALVLLAASILSACGPRNFANENDTLRARIHDLEREVTALELMRSELEAKLAEHATGVDPVNAEIIANTPRVADIRLDRQSHYAERDDGDVLTVYIEPVDGLGRFVQMVGDASVHVAVLPAAGDAVTIGQLTLGSGELRAAYRSGLTGTHYTVEVPVERPLDLVARFCETRVTFHDHLTGREHTAHRSIELP